MSGKLTSHSNMDIHKRSHGVIQRERGGGGGGGEEVGGGGDCAMCVNMRVG